ncbi:EpsG family protein, partial [Fusobacterium sp.]|uniref:EpsG family protein n=1 Tax=Fusobacterium sp. TaxID=68766 RepID=UPI003FA567A1
MNKIIINMVIFISLLINNFLAIPIYIFSILKKRESPFLIGIFFGVLGYYFRPYNDEYDIARYYSFFSDINLREWTFLYQKDIYAEYMVKFLLKYNLPKYFLGFSSAFLVYYFFFSSLRVILSKTEKDKRYFWYYFVFFITIPIIGYTGIRFYPAVAVFIYSLVLSIQKNKKYIFFMIVAISIHSSILLGVLIFFLNKFILKKIKYDFFKVLFVCSIIISFLLTSNNLKKIVEMINNLGIVYISQEYIFGKWGINYLSDFSLFSKIKNIIFLYYKLLIIIIYIFLSEEKNEIKKYIILLGSICCIFFKFQTLFDRYFYITLFLILIVSIR